MTVDAETEQCAAWDMSVMIRERVKIAESSRGSERSLTRTDGFIGQFRIVMDLEIPGLETREVRRASRAKRREQCDDSLNDRRGIDGENRAAKRHRQRAARSSPLFAHVRGEKLPLKSRSSRPFVHTCVWAATCALRRCSLANILLF